MWKEWFTESRWWVRALIVVAILVLADRVIFPRFSRAGRINADDVLVAMLPNEVREVHLDTEPRLLKQLVRSLNAGRTWMNPKIKLGELIILHFRHGPSRVISYGQFKDGGCYYFRGEVRDRYGQRKLYRAGGLGKVLEAILASDACKIKPQHIPPGSLGEAVCYGSGAQRTLPGSSPGAQRLLAAVNEFLQMVDTSCYRNFPSTPNTYFLEGEARPENYLQATTGTLLILDPPLSMHTTVVFSEYPPLVEYHVFKANRILLSDAISLSYLKSVGFSSDRKPNRFYLFFGNTLLGRPDRELATKRWNRIIASIESAVREPPATSQAGKGTTLAPVNAQTPFRPL